MVNKLWSHYSEFSYRWISRIVRAIPHLLIGSVAEKVVRKAPCPVLTPRSAKFRFEIP
ncbi:MAG: universal stress protein [bacterium]